MFKIHEEEISTVMFKDAGENKLHLPPSAASPARVGEKLRGFLGFFIIGIEFIPRA